MDHQRLAQLAERLDCLTDEDLQLLTGTTPATTESWRKRGAGPAYVLAGNTYLYPRPGVASWLAGNVRERRASRSASVL